MGLFQNLANSYIESKLGPDPRKQAESLKAAYGQMGSLMQQAAAQRNQAFAQANPAQVPNRQQQAPAPTELENWKYRIDAMMNTGNPALQKEALEQMNQYQTTVTSATTSSAPNAVKEYQYAKQTGAFTGTFTDWKKMNQPKNYQPAGEVPLSVTDASKIEMPDGNGGWRKAKPGVTPNEIRTAGGRIGKSNSSTDAGRTAMLQTAKNQSPIIKEMMYTEDGQVDRATVNLAALLSKDPTQGSVIGKTINNLTGMYTPQQVERAMQLKTALDTGFMAITRTETGAAMAKEEIDHTKTRFMPSFGESDNLTAQKMQAYEYFITTALDLIDPTIMAGDDPVALANEVSKLADAALEKFDVKKSKYDPNQTPEAQGYERVQ